ncbi:FAD-dependent oxidoreductase [Micromonospora sp. BRA006-A]|uniref:FAD-dependent oxidoreductase n=1 Tax=Micromonospora sp. BRA006-A TaxID=2962860 RepID=UPI00296EA187|nr:FAD-dependent oxidoreductase [Micromonospora sp. BRA006-A]MDW3849341.1 FAD-dependent oxidoreductase [Micromonospora sp. BRA006-A]
MSEDAIEHRTRVIVVGAGYAGLTAALFLAWRGVPVTLVERHPSTSVQPKAFGIVHRSMELLRQIPGLEEKILAADVIDFVNEAHITIATDMKDPNPEVLLAGNDDTMSRLIRLTPAGFGALPQSKIEAILRRTAEELGGDLRFSTRLESFDEDDDGVVATLVDLPTGRRYRVAADYLVAADGWQAPVREWLELPTHGVGELWRCRTILFDADLTELLAGRKALLTYFKNDEFTGLYAYLENAREVFGVSGAHLLGINYFIERGESDDDFTDERCVELVRKAMVEPDLEVTITDQSTFVIAHRVADRMREGRVFLAGDSAHVMPQTGGLGGATAIQDGYDIAWRIAAVVAGYAGPNLLTGYDAERRPVGESTANRQLHRLSERMAPQLKTLQFAEEVSPVWEHLGYRVHSPFVSTEPDDDGDLLEDPELAQARPGSRAPHVPVRHGDREISLLDLFGRDHVLLLGSPGTPWRAAAEKQAAALGVPLPVYAFGADLTDHTGEAARRYDLGPDTAVLVRPDGYVVWRALSRPDDPERALRDALTTVLGRAPEPVEPPQWSEPALRRTAIRFFSNIRR